jgi:putative xylitol transport system ATP-binding protein
MARRLTLKISDVQLISGATHDTLLVIDSLQLESGLVHGLVGHNLSGRSAFLRFVGGGLLCLSNESRGNRRLLVDNRDFAIGEEVEKFSIYLGPSPRDSISTLTLTTAEEIALHQRSANDGICSVCVKGTQQLIEQFRLDQCLNQNPMELSEGQTAALALVCAMEMQRPIICIDEMLSYLDWGLRKTAWELLDAFARNGGIVIIAENNYDFMAEYADQGLLFVNGTIAITDSLESVFNSPVSQKWGTVPNSSRLAVEIWGNLSPLPTKYDELVVLVRQKIPL